tara:strand:+ start:2942 stop:3121 length:180 start_codon:yes stop_codon:yes gene_type:complete
MGKTFKRSSSKWDDDDYDFQESDNRKAKKFKKLRESRRKKQHENNDLIENRDSFDDRPD